MESPALEIEGWKSQIGLFMSEVAVQFKRRSRMRPVSVEERKANPTHNSLKKGVLWEATTVEIMVLDARI